MAKVRAEPYEFEFDPASCALMIIDMQRDFVDPGGFGEALGNDVSLLRRAIAPTRKVLEAARAAEAEVDAAGGTTTARPKLGAPAPPVGEVSKERLSVFEDFLDKLDLDKLDLSFDPDRPAFEDPTPSVLDGQWHDAATKLDLAKAYQEMGDREGAREILQEVLHEGDEQQKSEAQSLLTKLA